MRKLLSALLLVGTLTAPAQTILVHGHRGARASRPENTIPAFEFAIAHGVDALELDLAVTKDNVLVVSHSPFLTQPEMVDPRMKEAIKAERKCAGPALPSGTPIHSLTLAELKKYDCGATTLANFPQQQAVSNTTIPTFDEVLDLSSKGNFNFNVETKSFINHPEFTPSPEIFVAMINEAVQRHHLDGRVILQSFDFRTLKAMRALNPRIRLSALFGEPKYDPIMGITDQDKTFAHMVKVTGADILSPDISLITPQQVDEAHKLGVKVIPYTVNTEEGWKRMAEAHVDGIITDDPAGLVQWLRKQHPPLHP